MKTRRTLMHLLFAILVALPALAQERSLDPKMQELADFTKANYTKYEYRIPMRDGVRLFTAVYVPKDASPAKTYPIMLTRTPYSVAPYGSDHYPSRSGPRSCSRAPSTSSSTRTCAGG